MIEECQMQKTLLYVGDEGEVSLDVIVDEEGKLIKNSVVSKIETTLFQ